MSARLRNVLWAVAVGVNGVLLIFLLNALYAAGFFARSMPARNDPALGTPLSSLLNHFLNGQKPLLIVTFGQCRASETCGEQSIRNVNKWVAMLKQWSSEVNAVIVAKESEQALKVLAAKHGWWVPVVADQEGKLLQHLNAYFLPRAYGFSPDGKLIWRQDSFAVTPPDAIRSVVEAVKGKDYAKKVFDQKPAWTQALEKNTREPKVGER